VWGTNKSDVVTTGSTTAPQGALWRPLWFFPEISEWDLSIHKCGPGHVFSCILDLVEVKFLGSENSIYVGVKLPEAVHHGDWQHDEHE